MTLRTFFNIALVLGVLAIASGCVVRSTPPAQLLVLVPLASAAQGTAATSMKPSELGPERVPALVIGPIDLPAYTERAQVLTLHGESELRAAVSARWAEPLDQNFSRVLVENLSRLLGTHEVTTLGSVHAPTALQITLEVTEFVVTDAGFAGLTAYWRVLGDGGRKVLASDKTHYQEPTNGSDFPALVAAMSRALAALSRDIALALQRIVETQ